MKSNVCKIDKGTNDLVAILRECEKVAAYNELTHKQALHLRLLCEEIDGMLPKLVEDFDGELWIEFENGVCKIHVALQLLELTAQKKEKLINIAKNKQNAEAVGIIGKIRSCIEDFFLTEESLLAYSVPSEQFFLATSYSEGVNYSMLWSLQQYRSAVIREEQAEQWDELEKSVIASVADDVVVGVNGKQVDVVVVKRFA